LETKQPREFFGTSPHFLVYIVKLRVIMKKSFISGIILFVFFQLYGFIVFALGFSEFLSSYTHIFRDMSSVQTRALLPLLHLTESFLLSFGLSFLYKKGLKLNAILASLIIFFFTICMGELYNFALYPVPFSLSAISILYGFLVYLSWGFCLKLLKFDR
jgi:hypothetical protein